MIACNIVSSKEYSIIPVKPSYVIQLVDFEFKWL